MPDIQDLSEAKRALLEKYLRGEVGSTALPSQAQSSPLVIQTPTEPVAVVTEVASATKQENRAPVILLKPGGSKRPIFYFHVHWIGGAFYCFNMAQQFGEDQPFYVFEPYRIDGLSATNYPSLEKMAADYLETMRSVQPEGPYTMVGFCGGGLIAFEIARQLRAGGEKTELLVLIEPLAGPARRRLIWPKFFRNLIGNMGKFLHLSPEQQFNFFLFCRHFYLSFRYQQEYRREKDFRFWPDMQILHKDWMAKFVWIISKYTPEEYPDKATFFWSEEIPEQRRLGWGTGSNAREIEVHIVPGTHDTCRTDYLSALTDELKQCLEKAREL